MNTPNTVSDWRDFGGTLARIGAPPKSSANPPFPYREKGIGGLAPIHLFLEGREPKIGGHIGGLHYSNESFSPARLVVRRRVADSSALNAGDRS